MVQNLFVAQESQVKDAPQSFSMLIQEYSNGYEYLILEPQAYMALSETDKRFELKLKSQYEYIMKKIEPVKVYDHFDKYMLASAT